VRLLLGLIKGIVIGTAVGFGAYQLHLTGGFHWVTYGVVGMLVGMLVGRPFWSHLADKNSTVVVAVVKATFGYLIGIGFYALVAKAAGGIVEFSLDGEQTRPLHDWQPLFGALLGGLYGAWVELDDAPPAKGKTAELPPH